MCEREPERFPFAFFSHLAKRENGQYNITSEAQSKWGMMALEEKAAQYFRAFRGKRVLVLGLGVSNRPLVKLLLEAGAKVTGCDKQETAEIEELERLGMELRTGEDYLKDISGEIAFRTPGMHPDKPELKALRDSGTVMTSEMEVFFEVCPCPVIGVTGSDGKTTTTMLIAELLKRAGKTVWVGGNIGAPLLPLAGQMSPEDVAVVELSSFQLLDMKRSPQVAVVTNVAPNHLDVHRDMKEYVDAKENILRFQGPENIAVLNADNEITRGFSERARGRVKLFSRRTRPEHGVYFEDGVIYRAGGRRLLEQSEILLPGLHNVENYMAAICAVEGMVSDDEIRAVAGSFQGVEHRIELVREKDGVRYYNDSIASSPSRTIAGLRSFREKVILIAGGYDKRIPYDALGPEIVEHVKLLVLTGATAGKIRAAVEGAPSYRAGSPEMIECPDFEDAIKTAASRAGRGDVVMLSPASASFDHFRNFMERGNAFKKAVWEL